MFTADSFVATFVEQDTRVVAVINDCIAHQFHPLLPLASLTVFFRISGRHCLYQTYTVARFYILFPWSDVHPTNQVCISFYHQTIREVAQPGWYGQTHCRPFIAGTLCISLHLDNTVVQFYFSFNKACFTESGAGADFIEYLIVVIFQGSFYRIQV